MTLLAGLCLCAGIELVALGSPQDLFQVDRTVDPPRVSADRNAVSADHALEQLAKSLGWHVRFETGRVQQELSLVALDLSFDGQSPRIVAHLVAMAGGADIAFDDRTIDGEPVTTLHVVSPPSSRTPSGRRRLRSWSMHWYQTFLAEDLRKDALVEEHAMDVRMHLGHLMLEQGDLEGAIRVFKSIHEADRTHPFVPTALLRLSQCLFDLREFDESEQWARKISRMHPSRPETAAATVLLGRTLLQGKRYDECVRTMRASMLPLAGTPEAIDIFLITAEAHWHRHRPDEVRRQVELLASSDQFKEIGRDQWLDYQLLRGIGASGEDDHAQAMEAFEAFLGVGRSHPRRGMAFVLVGESYLKLGRFVEARAAARRAMELVGDMEHEWVQRTRVLDAKTALVLGDKERAIADLEVEIRRDPAKHAELLLYLVGALIDEGLYQKAIMNADLLAVDPGLQGDRARYLRVLAMFKQGRRASDLKAFPVAAIRIAKRVEDKGHQAKVAEIIGRAYEEMGMVEQAADAYRGVLR